MQSWWWDSVQNLGGALISAALFYLVLIAVTRIAGLRAYSKMSGFDFPLTVAVGSIIASTVLVPDPPLVRASLVMGWILLLQGGVAWLRSRFDGVRRLVDNTPVVLMREGRIMEKNMRAARVSLPELREKIREAGIHRLDDIGAVVLETTGDVNVIPSPGGDLPQDWIMADVRTWEESATGGSRPV